MFKIEHFHAKCCTRGALYNRYHDPRNVIVPVPAVIPIWKREYGYFQECSLLDIPVSACLLSFQST
jgi:hypothetical protein